LVAQASAFVDDDNDAIVIEGMVWNVTKSDVMTKLFSAFFANFVQSM
jgi:hypothetical protein